MSATQSPARSTRPDATRHRRAEWSPSTGQLTFRPDIEGLRAVAVLLVVLQHAGVSIFTGGYVGVDVFFVISGFLITSLLLKETVRTGRISVVGFYSRRMMRLLPASTLVLFATLAGAWLWQSPLRFRQTATEAIASAFYFVNFGLAADQTDYFASETPSPLQHFWSLAVEEQFYLGWPVLIIAATWAATRLRRRPILVVAAVLVPLVLASFVLSVTETHRSAPWAYFGSHTRAWELGVGAILALASGQLACLRRAPATVLSWLGLAAILAAAVLYTDATPFPGIAALLPVAGTAMLIAAGGAAARIGAGAVLCLSPMQFIGGLSYGLYLWHWPMLHLGPIALGIDDGIVIKLLLCCAAAVLAFVSLRWVENPVRRLAVLRTRPRHGITLGLSMSIVASATALVTAVAFPPMVRYGSATIDAQQAVRTADDPAEVLRQLVAESARRDTLPSNLSPTLAESRDDFPASYRDGCHLDFADVASPGLCAYGDVNAVTTVVLFGDSHAAQWLPGLTRLASLHRWRLLSRTKSSCTPADVQISIEKLKRIYVECDTYRRNTLNEIKRIGPALVIMASIIDRPMPAPNANDAPAIWSAGWTRTFESIRGSADAAVLLVDTPRFDQELPNCAAANPTRLTLCAAPREVVLRGPDRRAAIAAAATRLGVTVVNPNVWLCTDVCPVTVGNLLVYRDAHHLTQAYSTTLSWPLDAVLTPLVNKR